MRDLIVRLFDALVLSVVTLMIAGTVGLAIFRFLTDGFGAGLLTLSLGLIGSMITGGVFFSIINIHNHTRRTAEAMELLTAKLGNR